MTASESTAMDARMRQPAAETPAQPPRSAVRGEASLVRQRRGDRQPSKIKTADGRRRTTPTELTNGWINADWYPPRGRTMDIATRKEAHTASAGGRRQVNRAVTPVQRRDGYVVRRLGRWPGSGTRWATWRPGRWRCHLRRVPFWQPSAGEARTEKTGSRAKAGGVHQCNAEPHEGRLPRMAAGFAVSRYKFR